MKKLLLVALLLGPLAILVESCRTCKCPDTGKYLKIERAALTVYSLESKPTPVLTPISDSAKIKLSNLSFALEYQFSYYSRNSNPHTGFSFIPAANACDCVGPGESGSKDKIVSITIETVNKYNNNWLAGQSLNSIVNINGQRISDFITDWNINPIRTSVVTFTELAEEESWQQFKLTIVYGSQQFNSSTKTYWTLP